jgi:hypothetical protein
MCSTYNTGKRDPDTLGYFTNPSQRTGAQHTRLFHISHRERAPNTGMFDVAAPNSRVFHLAQKKRVQYKAEHTAVLQS